MSDKFTVTFDKSDEDIPVLMVGREGYGGFMSAPTMNIQKVITGDRAVQLYDELTSKKEKSDATRKGNN